MTAPPDDTTTDTSAIIAALRAERDAGLAREAALAEELAARDATLAQRNTEYGERMDHQAATIDVLKVMSATPGDPQPVFDLIVRRATELCNGLAAALYQFDGSLVYFRAVYHVAPDPDRFAGVAAMFPMAPTREIIACRAILDRQIVHIRDTEVEPGLSEVVRERLRRSHRSQVSIPLMRDGHVIGAISLGGKESGGFTDSQIALLQTFAEQAVIAISSAETYRALQTRTSDLQETLEYQTATSDVLNVISRSTFDLQPVLDTVAETAARLCNAEQAAVYRCDGDSFQLVTNCGWPPEYEARQREVGRYGVRATSPGIPHQAIIKRRAIHIHDVTTVPDYPEVAIKLGKERTGLGVPLLREGEPVGVIVLARQRVEPFTDRQIALVSTFADQAVIAIENTRLLTEQQEALEQQTATAEVLQVINASPGNLEQVFATILEKAILLCDSSFGGLSTYDGEFFHFGATRGMSPVLAKALRERGPLQPSKSFAYDQIIRGADIVHIPDIIAAGRPFPSSPNIDQDGARTTLFIALRGDDALFGVLVIFRKEVRLFSDRQIALLKNFAAQAVIAMENARLITEQQEALEQQTATAEVLQVINASPGNLTPVFDAMLDRAMRLCGAAFGSLYTYDGERFHSAAQRGVPPAYAAFRAENPPLPTPGGGPATLLETRRPFQVLDVRTHENHRPDYPSVRAMVELGGVRTILSVPLIRDDETFLGFISIFRQEVRAFSAKQIALLENFAAQAVIAMENARLITEQREALEQQTATTEVLQVINASPGELGPVFDAMLTRAMRLCGAVFGSLSTWDGNYANVVATQGFPPALAEYMASRSPRLAVSPVIARLSETKRPQQLLDVMAGEGYRNGHPVLRAVADLGGARTILHVPLRKDEAMVGYVSVYRNEVRAFSDKEITLLENFAAQAVIAMENARLLNELRARTDELARRQEELRVTFENMGDGVAMFDEVPRLVAWNRKFQDILDVPDDAIGERPTLDEYIRYLTERGEFGRDADPNEQVGHLQATRGQSAVFERTRPNGRIIEVRNNPVAGGGFVLIYADITERKRNEAEIRAARDAAEEASRTIEVAYRDLKAAQANLIQAEKMASLGQLTAGIAHEIKNPLNFVNNFAELSVDLLGELKDAITPAEAALNQNQRDEVDEVVTTLTSNLEKITEHGKRADGIVKAMLEHSRGSSAERRMVDLNVVIDEALNLAYHGARAQDQSFNITLERDFGEGIASIEVNPQDMTRVFLNIFSNGFYAATRRARSGGDAGFVPTLKVITRDPGEVVEIRVRDNGTGIPADIRDKLFQPFFTTKPTGEGTGLGLSITYDIVTKQHGGTIRVESEVDAFTEFVVTLPRQMFTNGGSQA